ncbi:MAG: serpin family protein [bacterium]|nr:serpin family protein [bacterium]
MTAHFASRTVTLPPLLFALGEASQMLKQEDPWVTTNVKQETFLRTCVEGLIPSDLISLLPEIESMASWNAGEINAWLRARGFSIELSPFDADTFGIAAVFKLLLEWFEVGTSDLVIAPDGQTYPGFKLETDTFVQIGRSSLAPHPIVLISAKNGDQVFLTKTVPGFLREDEDFVLVDRAREILGALDLDEKPPFTSVIIPKVDLNQSVDIGWLQGMNAMTQMRGVTERATLIEAKQQTKLRMNEHGAKVESAAAMGVCLECYSPEENLVINEPFLMVVTRTGIRLPLFVGIIGEEDWKDPGKL